MQEALVQHYTAEFLENILKELALKFPSQPLGSVLTNYLMFSEDGTENTRLRVLGAKLLQLIDYFKELPDECAFEQKEIHGINQ